MPRSYLRYVPWKRFGVIASPNCRAILSANGRFAISAALQSVVIHHIQRGSVDYTLTVDHTDADANSPVTCLMLHPVDADRLAVGYANGLIRIWSIRDRTIIATFNGHSSSVNSLAFNDTGSLLYGGSADARISCWDLVAEKGLHSLKGHKDAVTCIALIDDKILSSSKDGTLKVWDSVTQHCIQTIIGGHHEVWSFAINRTNNLIVAGGADDTMRVFSYTKQDESVNQNHDEFAESYLSLIGELPRLSKKRVAGLSFSPDGQILAVQCVDKALQLFAVKDEETTNKRAKKRVKRTANQPTSQEPATSIHDRFVPMNSVKLDAKLSGCSFMVGTAVKNSFAHRCLLTLADNSMRVYDLAEEETGSHTLTSTLELGGHRAPLRSVSFNHARTQILTAGAGEIKVWDLHSGQCVRTLACGEALCLLVVPGDRHVVVGTKTGDLEWFDLSTSRCLGRVRAHEGSVLCCDLRSDGRAFVTGGSDKKLNEFEFELIVDEESQAKPPAKILSIALSRTLTLTDDILCVRYSPQKTHIAVSLLDSSVRLFHADTLAFALSLYGHRLPVLSIDFSDDGQLIVTGAADKNIKIWGATFGDCHASIFAHADTVTQCKFLPGSHIIVTAGKDNLLKMWDGDSREFIQELAGHQGEIWAVDVLGNQQSGMDDESEHGELIVSVGNDRAIQIWSSTDEPLFPEEERENRLERLFDEKSQGRQNKIGAIEGSGAVVELESDALTANRAREPAMKASEKLVEAVTLAHSEKLRIKSFEASQQAEAAPVGDEITEERGINAIYMQMKRDEASVQQKKGAPTVPSNPLLNGRTPAEYVLNVLYSIPSSDLLDALLALPFASALQLMDFLLELIAADSGVELCTDCALSLVNIHEARIVGHGLLQTELKTLRKLARRKLRQMKDECGVNLAALNAMYREQQLIAANVNK